MNNTYTCQAQMKILNDIVWPEIASSALKEIEQVHKSQGFPLVSTLFI